MMRLTPSLLRSSVLALIAVTFSSADAAPSGKLRFVSIGTAGPAGAYFAVGKAICHSVHQAQEKERDPDQRSHAGDSRLPGQIVKILS